ncbi:Aste57867_16283 [Aphanomyces stellatus]|uniref:Aste57867_16283 protein n=1 Tax=Aphanomyces stellatus TaxID=120398 RepID=A0A485L547_9STRA|nr:hypothetical protein As57867_016226 [Aphanomyces stellatus]VFT93059.1 Aste57867_16283 [Aphanomyces stellatus]
MTTSIYGGAFDTAALQQELAQALEEDRKYKLTDEMKKRAIHTAGSYDEFRNFVLCADLKPVSSKELQNLSRSARKRNRGFLGDATTTTSRGKTLQGKRDASVPPATSVEFVRTWHRSCTTQATKYAYLELTTPARLQALFSAELGTDLLFQLVACLNAQFVDLNPHDEIDDFERELAHVAFSIDMLDAMAKTGRFNLTLAFLEPSQLFQLQALFTRLYEVVDRQRHHGDDVAAGQSAVLDALHVAYEMPVAPATA